MSRKARKSLARRLAAYSLAGGAVALASASTAQAAPVYYNHRDDPIHVRAAEWLYTGETPPPGFNGVVDQAVFYMDGTYKYELWEQGGEGWYLAEGEDITEEDRTDDSVWFNYQTFVDPGGDVKIGTQFQAAEGNGIVAHDRTNGRDADQLLAGQDGYATPDADVVDENQSFTTDGAPAVIFGRKYYTYGWYDGYVGFSLEEEDGTHYGWVEVNVAYHSCVDFLGWAYETEADTALPVGLPVPLAGDCDLDGDVDWSDYQALEAAFGTETGATWGDGDFDWDGDVDWADYQELEANFGTGTSGIGNLGNGPVPEPMTLSVLALGAAGLLASRRKQ